MPRRFSDRDRLPDRLPDREDGEGDVDVVDAVAIDAPGVDEEAVVPWPLLLRRRAASRVRSSDRYPWIVTWTVLFGTFWVASTITILAVSRPEIAEDLGASVESLVWLISGPTIAVAIVGTTAGKLGDLHGHRKVFLAGMVGATVFVILTVFAWSGLSLIAFRVLGATLGAATGPSSLAIISRLFPPDERSRALGFWSLVVAGGPVVGLVIGGPMVDAFGWRAIFVIQAPLLLASAVLAWIVLPETDSRRDVHFDVAGQVVLAASLGGLLLAIDRGPAWGFASVGVVAGLLVFVVALAGFIRVESRVAHPLIPLGWFRRRSFAVPAVVSFTMQFAYMGGFILTPKLLEEVRDLDSTFVSLVMVPRPLTFAIVGPIAGYLSARITARQTVLFGTTCLALSMLAFVAVVDDPSTGVVVVALTLSGIGVGAAQPRIAAAVANTVSVEDLGVAGATQQLLAQVGTTVGMNMLETVQVATGPSDVGSSYAPAYALGAGVAIVGVVASLWMHDPADDPTDDPTDDPASRPDPVL